MAQNKVDNIQVNAPKDIDNKRGVWIGNEWRPYNNVVEAVNSIPIETRYRSLTVSIFKGGIPTDYYWRDGVSDNQLVEKTISGTNYTLPKATLATLGGIIVGDGLNIDEETGILSVTGGGGGIGTGTVTSVGLSSNDFTITNSPITTSGTITANIKNSAVTFAKMQNVASGVLIGRGLTGTGTLGVITIGSGLNLSSSNVLSSTGGGGGSQTLQQTLNLGRVGDSMQITNSLQIPVTPPAVINTGDIWIGSGTTSGGGGGGYVLPIATDTTLGGIKVGTGLAINATTGVLSATGGGSYTLPTASATVLGGIKVGTGLAIDAVTGVLSATGGGTGTVTSVAMTVPTGLSITGSPITSSGTLALTLSGGYSIPTTGKQTQWDDAYSHSQVTNSNPHTTTLQQILSVANTGTAMKITASMEIPTVAPTTIQAGSIWIGSGTSA